MSLRQPVLRCRSPGAQMPQTPQKPGGATLTAGTSSVTTRAGTHVATPGRLLAKEGVMPAQQRSFAPPPRCEKSMPRSRSESPAEVAKTSPKCESQKAKYAGQRCGPFPQPGSWRARLRATLWPQQELPTLLSRHRKEERRRATLSSLQENDRRASNRANAHLAAPEAKIDVGRKLSARPPKLAQNVVRSKSASPPPPRSRVELNSRAEPVWCGIAEDSPAIPACGNGVRQDMPSTVVDPKLFAAAMSAGSDDKVILHSSQATARLLLLHRFQSQMRCRDLGDCEQGAAKEMVGIGRAAVETLFFSSLPKELVEIVGVQEIVQADAMKDFLHLLVAKDRLVFDVRYHCQQEGRSPSEIASSAGAAHRLAAGIEHDDSGSWCALVVIVAADRHGDLVESDALPACRVTYRLCDGARNLTACVRQKRFQDVLHTAVENASLLASETAL